MTAVSFVAVTTNHVRGSTMRVNRSQTELRLELNKCRCALWVSIELSEDDQVAIGTWLSASPEAETSQTEIKQKKKHLSRDLDLAAKGFEFQ